MWAISMGHNIDIINQTKLKVLILLNLNPNTKIKTTFDITFCIPAMILSITFTKLVNIENLSTKYREEVLDLTDQEESKHHLRKNQESRNKYSGFQLLTNNIDWNMRYNTIDFDQYK